MRRSTIDAVVHVKCTPPAVIPIAPEVLRLSSTISAGLVTRLRAQQFDQLKNRCRLGWFLLRMGAKEIKGLWTVRVSALFWAVGLSNIDPPLCEMFGSQSRGRARHGFWAIIHIRLVFPTLVYRLPLFTHF